MQKPLLVDLDGSLILTDTLYEMAVLAVKDKPWVLFLLPFWLMQGKALLKARLAAITNLNMASLPVNGQVIKYLREQHNRGRDIVLCTGTWSGLAESFAAQYPFFKTVVGTTEDCNLTGKNKARWAVETFGEKGFDYLGNEEKDVAVWKQADSAVVVGDEKLSRKASKVTAVSDRLDTPDRSLGAVILKAMRIHQWAKNALLFVPLITSHQIFVAESVLKAVIGFLAMGLCASATYLLNDMFDLEADRAHKIKRNRPMASGTLSIPQGVALGGVLLASGLILAFLVNIWFVAALLVYLLLTILYSFKLKKLQTIDVITLASLFTTRVIAGAAAIKVDLSFWLLCFSMFMFLSLAIVKRVAELIKLENERGLLEGEKVKGRGYFSVDLITLQCLGGTAGFLAVLVFALYINSSEVVKMYNRPEVLWLMCPVLGYWIMRVWMLTARNEMNEDPISFAVTDRNSWLAFLVMAIVLSVALFV